MKYYFNIFKFFMIQNKEEKKLSFSKTNPKKKKCIIK